MYKRQVLTSFPAASGRHDVESIVHDLYLKMVAAFDAGQVPLNTTEFLRFAAFKLRNLLLDESRRAAVRRAKGIDEFDPGTSAGEPGLLAQWTEFHTRVGALPDDERQVVELCYYLGVSQAEVAEQLDIHPRKVSRLMASAVGKLEKYLPGHG